MKRRFVLSYDMATLPKGMTAKDMVKKANEEGIVYYASNAAHNFGGKNTDNKPEILDLHDGIGENPNYKMKDVSKNKK